MPMKTLQYILTVTSLHISEVKLLYLPAYFITAFSKNNIMERKAK
jgi:fucose permease